MLHSLFFLFFVIQMSDQTPASELSTRPVEATICPLCEPGSLDEEKEKEIAHLIKRNMGILSHDELARLLYKRFPKNLSHRVYKEHISKHLHRPWAQKQGECNMIIESLK
jgi:hypothetical protein